MPDGLAAETREGAVESNLYATAILNVLDDFVAERDRLAQTQKAILNILEDFASEKERLEGTARAVVNILEDFGSEKARLQGTQRAILNIIEDLAGEKSRLEKTERAMLNLLDDINQEKAKAEAANSELTQKTAELTRSNADLEQFAYVASHDLQEPLRMVSSYMQLFERKYAGRIDEQGEKYLHYAVEGALRMRGLINGLLEYSRAARKQVEPKPVDANAALEQALWSLRGAIEEAGAVVTHEALPAVVCDLDHLAQVFQNLISNAVKFRRPDVVPQIHISAAPRGQLVVFAVQDNGIGIEARHTERIFVIFQRLQTRTPVSGTGIGLSVCKKVVERYGGRIWVESEPGQGSTFCFTMTAAGPE